MELKLSNQYLNRKTEPWDFFNPPMDIIELSQSMVSFMYERNGIGLSANQVGIPYSVFAMRNVSRNEDGDYIIINPRIVNLSEKVMDLEEACLSYPGLVIKRSRPMDVRTRFYAPSGELFTRKFDQLQARIFLHEFDHLQGLPFWDTVSKLKFDMAVRKAKKKGFTLNVGYHI